MSYFVKAVYKYVKQHDMLPKSDNVSLLFINMHIYDFEGS